MEHRADIAVLSFDLSGTGVVRNGVRLANLAAGMGLAAEYWAVRPEGALAEGLDRSVGLRGIGGGTLRKLPRNAASLWIIPALARMIGERKPRILLSAGNHFHLPSSLAYRLAGRPREVRFMGRASNAVPGRERLGALTRIARPLISATERLKYAGMDPVIAVAEELGGRLAETGIAAQRIRVIPNGVDVEAIAARGAEPISDAWLEPGAPPVVLGVGRLARQKDFGLLIEAFALARREMPMRLVLLGEGREQARLAALAGRLGVAGDVGFRGFAPNPFAWFSRASLTVLSSRWEGMSNVLLEAMACGCPVAAVNAPTGTAEVLGHGRFGPLIAKREPEALARAMLARLQAPRDAAALQARAGEYSLARTLDAYAALFSACLEKGPALP